MYANAELVAQRHLLFWLEMGTEYGKLQTIRLLDSGVLRNFSILSYIDSSYTPENKFLTESQV